MSKLIDLLVENAIKNGFKVTRVTNNGKKATISFDDQFKNDYDLVLKDNGDGIEEEALIEEFILVRCGDCDNSFDLMDAHKDEYPFTVIDLDSEFDLKENIQDAIEVMNINVQF